MEYDEERELTRYVWDHFGRFMSEFERRVGLAHLADAKAAAGHPAMTGFIRRRHGITGDPEAEAALAGGVEEFRRKVCRRVLDEHGEQILINRCPGCARVVLTPARSPSSPARQPHQRTGSARGRRQSDLPGMSRAGVHFTCR